MRDFVQFLIGAAVVGAIVGGIFRVYANKRALARTEARNGIDEVRGLLDKVQELARNYYILDGVDQNCPVLGLEIRNALQKIGTRVTILHQRFRSGDRSILSYAFRFKQAVSLDLDSRLRKCCTSDDNRFLDIQAKAEALLLQLETQFDREYR
jgi:hypothetical protein